MTIVLISAVDARSGVVWAAETALPLFLVSWLAATARSFPLSSLSYAAIFVFLVLHQIGAHFTYPEVPLPDWITGAGTLEPQAARNPYDRIAHFSYGLLFTYPLLEVAVRMVGARGFWRSAVPVCLVVTTSVLYEFIEWFFAVTIGGAAGTLVLGTQGRSVGYALGSSARKRRQPGGCACHRACHRAWRGDGATEGQGRSRTLTMATAGGGSRFALAREFCFGR